jgi:D-alanine-D-alanine ligase-like ATP-grasp enzyme/predicted O-methyltransferase YrrM
MYTILILSSNAKEAGVITFEKLLPQIKYLNRHNIEVKLMVDPERLILEKELLAHFYNIIYVTTPYRYYRDTADCVKRDYNYFTFLEQLDYKYVGSDSFTQSVLLDKTLCGHKAGIAPVGRLVTREMFNNDPSSIIDEVLRTIRKFPLIVKPNSLSASLGINSSNVIRDLERLKVKTGELFSRFKYLNEVRIEEFIENSREFTVSVLGNDDHLCYSVTELKHIRKMDGVYGEKDKKTPIGERKLKYASEIEQSIKDELIFHSKRLFKWFGMKDFGRFDYRYDSRAYLLEINALPDPSNSFSWEWKKKYHIDEEQILALQLLPAHFRIMNSGIPSPIPKTLVNVFPNEIIETLKHSLPCHKKPESTPPSSHCQTTHLYTMTDRVSAESEVLHFLKALVILLKPSLILETGTYKGSTSIALATGLLENGVGRLVTIEKDIFLADHFKSQVEGLPIEVVTGDSLNYVPNCKIDLLYLDSHRPIRIKEFLRFKPFLNKKSIIVWHDSSPEHKVVFDSIERLYNLKVIDRLLLPTPRGLTISMLTKSAEDYVFNKSVVSR